ncbi:hypothetical protein GGF37_003939 [Kickxella alabastrina]|nr:hypothetical protein GGF37_003939 [Kickxella alabastrina]
MVKQGKPLPGGTTTGETNTKDQQPATKQHTTPHISSIPALKTKPLKTAHTPEHTDALLPHNTHTGKYVPEITVAESKSLLSAQEMAETYTYELHENEWGRDETWLRFSQLPRGSHDYLRNIDINRTLALIRGSDRRSRRDGGGAPTSKTMSRMLAVYGAASEAGINPDHYTFQEMIAINVDLLDFRHAREWLARMLAKGIQPTIRPYRALLKGYSRVPGEIDNARQLWQEIKQQLSAGQISSNSSESGTSANLDIKTYTCIIGAECKVGNFAQALSLVDEMSAAGMEPDIAVRNVILDGIANHSGMDAALEEIGHMESAGLKPDGYTYNILLNAAVREGRNEQTRELLSAAAAAGFIPSIQVVQMLPFEPVEIVDIMAEGSALDRIRVYNTLIKASMRRNNFNQVLQLIGHLRKHNVQANVVTYGMLLDALNKAGRLEQAKSMFKEIVNSRKVQPDLHIFSTMVDACGRSGDIDGMFWFKSKMSAYGVPPAEFVYNSVFSALARWRKDDLSVIMATVDELVRIRPPVRPTIRTLNSIFAAFAGHARTAGLDASETAFLRTWYANTSSKYYVVKDSYLYALALEAFTATKSLDDALTVYSDMVRHSEMDMSVVHTFAQTPGHMLGLMRLAIEQLDFEVVLRLWRDWRPLGMPESDAVVPLVLFACDQMGHPGTAQDIMRSLLTTPEANLAATAAAGSGGFYPRMVNESTLALYIGIVIKHGIKNDIIPTMELWRTSVLAPSLPEAASAGSLEDVRWRLDGSDLRRRLSEETVTNIIRLLWQHNSAEASDATDKILAYVDKNFPEAMPV